MTDTPFNQNAVNSLCRKLLAKAKVKPDPGILYCIQLAKWVLETYGLDGHWAKYRGEIAAHIEALLGYDDQLAQSMFHLERFQPFKDESDLLAESLYKTSPLRAGFTLLENLFSNMEQLHPGMRI